MLTQAHNILIVDDSPEDRNKIQHYLNKNAKTSPTILEAATGEEGLKTFEVSPPHCILLDYHLPDMDGLAFLAELKNKTNDKHQSIPIPVIMLTGYGDEKIAVEAMENGASDYLVKKDLHPEVLQRTIANALEKAELQLKLKEQQQELENLNNRRNEQFSGILESIKPNVLKRYQLLSENTLDIILFIRPDGTILEANRAATLAYGYSLEELQSLNIQALRVLETLSLVGTQMQQASSKGIIFETLHRRKDGNIFPVEVTSRGIELDNEQVLLSVIRDISERKVVEKVLQESEERYRLLTDYATDLISKLALDGRILYVSPSCRTILGYEPAEVEGHLVFEFLHPDDLETTSRTVEKGLLQISSVTNCSLRSYPALITHSGRFRRKDGRYIWFETHSRLIRDPATGSPQYLVGASRDITSRKQAEEILRKWTSVFEHAQWGIAIANPENNTFEVVNPAFAQMFGYEVEELTDKPISLVFAPQIRSELPAMFRLHNEQGGAIFESIHLRKNGTALPVIINVALVRDETGKPLNRVVNVQDITQLKQVEEDLRTSEARLQAILDNAPVAIYVRDLEGRFLFANQWIRTHPEFGKNKYEGHGQPTGWPKSVEEVFSEEISDEWLANDRKVLEAGEMMEFEETSRFGGGSRQYHSIKFPLFDPNGQPYAICGISTDISERKRAKEERQQLLEREQFARQQAQAATLRITRLQAITVALSQTLTPDEVAQIIVGQGLEALGASTALICLITPSGQELSLLNSNNYPDEIVKRWYPLPLYTPVPLTQAIRTGSLVLIESLEERQQCYPFLEPIEISNEPGGLAAIPLEIKGCAIGVLGLNFKGFPKFSPEDRATMITLGQLFAQALERTRLYEAEQRARQEAALVQKQLALLAEVSTALSSALNDNTIANVISDIIIPELAEWCFIALMEEDGRYRRIDLTHNDPAKEAFLRQEVNNFPLPPKQVLAVIETGQPLLVSEVSDSFLKANSHDAAQLEFLRFIAPQSLIHVPLIIRDQTIGVLSLILTGSRRYDQKDLSVAQEIARRIAQSLDNVRLYEQARKLSVVEERQRIAQELHDSVSQVLYSIGLGVNAAQDQFEKRPDQLPATLKYLASLAKGGMSEMQALLFELRPELLARLGLVVALTRQTEVLHTRYQLEVVCELESEPEVSLKIKEALYRIAQEALHNVIKHARATQIELRLKVTASRQTSGKKYLLLQIQDNGRGFEVSASFPGHLGLPSMQERAEMVGGRLKITSGSDIGTFLQVTIPLN